MDFNRVTKAYIAIRDKRSEIKKAYELEDEKLKEDQKKLEGAMLRALNDSGADSMKTASGTFYKTEVLKPSASDWQSLYDWIKENDAFEFLERRIKAASVKEYMEVHDGAMPPGVNVHREYTCNVRRA